MIVASVPLGTAVMLVLLPFVVVVLNPPLGFTTSASSLLHIHFPFFFYFLLFSLATTLSCSLRIIWYIFRYYYARRRCLLQRLWCLCSIAIYLTFAFAAHQVHHDFLLILFLLFCCFLLGYWFVSQLFNN